MMELVAQLIGPEVGHGDRLLQHAGLGRRLLPVLRVDGQALLQRDVHVVLAGRHREGAADPVGLGGRRRRGQRDERDVLVDVLGMQVLRLLVLALLGISGRLGRGRDRRLAHDAREHRQHLAGGRLGLVERDREGHVGLAFQRLQGVVVEGHRDVGRRLAGHRGVRGADDRLDVELLGLLDLLVDFLALLLGQNGHERHRGQYEKSNDWRRQYPPADIHDDATPIMPATMVRHWSIIGSKPRRCQRFAAIGCGKISGC